MLEGFWSSIRNMMTLGRFPFAAVASSADKQTVEIERRDFMVSCIENKRAGRCCPGGRLIGWFRGWVAIP
jgi:hypothetical protein